MNTQETQNEISYKKLSSLYVFVCVSIIVPFSSNYLYDAASYGEVILLNLS